jgi:uncharacterized spore protein YtfJ
MRSDPSEGGAMNAAEAIIGQARDAMTVKRVYGDPVERDGITVIPAAAVRGGGGGGGDETDEGKGSRGGFGLAARPIGSYVVDSDGVRWHPAVDWTVIALGLEALALVGLLVYRSVETRRIAAR